MGWRLSTWKRWQLDLLWFVAATIEAIFVFSYAVLAYENIHEWHVLGAVSKMFVVGSTVWVVYLAGEYIDFRWPRGSSK